MHRILGEPAAQQAGYADILGNHTLAGLGLVLQQDAGNANRYAFSYSNGAGGWIITKRIKLIELGLMTIGSRELVQPERRTSPG